MILTTSSQKNERPLTEIEPLFEKYVKEMPAIPVVIFTTTQLYIAHDDEDIKQRHLKFSPMSRLR